MNLIEEGVNSGFLNSHNRKKHNQSEKSRRAQLRKHLEKLKEVVPKCEDGQKQTTLELLARAKHFIAVRAKYLLCILTASEPKSRPPSFS